jgi:hypothetical protein
MEEKPSRAKKLTIAALRAVALMDLLAIPFGLGPVRGLAQNLPPPEDISVMSCVNGTGGCGQEFIERHLDGRWYPVRQDWLDQLPQGFLGRIRHSPHRSTHFKRRGGLLR